MGTKENVCLHSTLLDVANLADAPKSILMSKNGLDCCNCGNDTGHASMDFPLYLFHLPNGMGQSTETAHLASLLAGRESQAQSLQSAIQPSLSGMPPASGSVSQRRVSSHRHHEEFLKVESLTFGHVSK